MMKHFSIPLVVLVISIPAMGNNCKGDINEDGLIDALDVSVMIRYLNDAAQLTGGYTVRPVPAADEEYNLNGDDAIDALDLSALIAYLTPYAPTYTTINCMP